MKSFKQFVEAKIDENIGGLFKNASEWESSAKSRGLVVKSMTHPSGEATKYQIAKDKQGNNRGHFDHGTKSGHLKEEADLDEADGTKRNRELLATGRISKDEFDKRMGYGKYRTKDNSKKLDGPGGLYKNLVKRLGEEADLDEEKDPRIERAGVQGFNKPKATPSHPEKSHIVVAKDGNQIKTIRFGEQGAETAGDPKEGESARMKAKRKSFKARHGKNIAKGKMSAAYWADKVKW